MESYEIKYTVFRKRKRISGKRIVRAVNEKIARAKIRRAIKGEVLFIDSFKKV